MKRNIYRILEDESEYLSLEELVGLCDHDAENINAHEFVGTHRLLGAVLYKQYGRDNATHTMLTIASHGGLHGMNGVFGSKSAYEHFNVGKEGQDWDGKYGN